MAPINSQASPLLTATGGDMLGKQNNEPRIFQPTANSVGHDSF
jgi:hypothetical protein